MKNSFIFLRFLLCLISCIEIGCSTYQGRFRPSMNIETTKDNIDMLSNNFSNSEKNSDYSNNSDLLISKGKLIVANADPCKIKYHKLNLVNRNIIIEGKLGIDEYRYPVVLDTGASQPVVLNDTVVRQNNLPELTIEDFDNNTIGHKLGLCKLSNLNIGEVTLEGWPGIYFKSNTELNFFGIPIASSTFGYDNIILGLPLLREFKYITFDNINKETELSFHKSFEPDNQDQWEKYFISIEEDFHGNAFLFVYFEIAGHKVELQLDTGSGRGLAISESIWKQIRTDIKATKLRNGKDFYPYIGNLSCKKGNISKLQFNDRIVQNAEISVFNKDCPLLDGCDGLVGMQYFSNNIFVLDFEHDLMWIKR